MNAAATTAALVCMTQGEWLGSPAQRINRSGAPMDVAAPRLKRM